ncbi:MAG TPA: hypothetical protein VHZ76_07490, partial [Gammaproteobacteria bacterium]|nr:hypothetical protein [Gammaproteobacteria bacterium]
HIFSSNENKSVNNVEKLLTKLSDDIFVKSNRNTFLHRYYLGNWEKRQIFTGLLVSCETLLKIDNLPAIYEQLKAEPEIY